MRFIKWLYEVDTNGFSNWQGLIALAVFILVAMISISFILWVIANAVIRREEAMLKKIEEQLKEIGIGEYDQDVLEHAMNTIRNSAEAKDKIQAIIDERRKG